MNDPSILQFQQMLSAAPDPLFTELYPNYSAHEYYRPLIQELLNTLQAYRDIPCQYGFRNKLAETASFRDLICLMSSLYKPVPLTPNQLHDNSQFVNGEPMSSGANGDVYSTNFPHIPIITKVSKANNAPESLRETFFNYRIVNEFILRGMTGLVETYGFFFCDKPSLGQTQPICNQGTGYPWLNLVQKNVINSITFKKALQLRNIGGQILDGSGQSNPLYDIYGVLTLDHVKQLVSTIFSMLTVMQESPYQVNHNDLHPGNILILNDGTIKLIDWGLVSFTFQGTRYKSFLDARYTRNPDGSLDMLDSGANDAFFLLNAIRLESPVQEIKVWAGVCLHQLFYNRLIKRTEYVNGRYDNYINPRLDPPWLLINLKENENAFYHRQNLDYLNTLTYRNICSQLSGEGIVIYNFPLTDRANPFPEPESVPIVHLEELGKKLRSRNKIKGSKRKGAKRKGSKRKGSKRKGSKRKGSRIYL
jgi:hypothetical protein